MAIGPREILAYARNLQPQAATNEVCARSAVSRAYYAAYHAARLFHETLPEPGTLPPAKAGKDDGMGKHAELIMRLQNPSPKVRRDSRQIASISVAVGSLLNVIKANRVTADYIIDKTVGEQLVGETLQSATTILEKCYPDDSADA